MKTLLTIGAAAFLIALLPGRTNGMRTSPLDVPPVVHNGIEYRAPHFKKDGRLNMGHVEAWDVKTNSLLWDTQVYAVQINPLIEEDVQWVFILTMRVGRGRLLVTNERGRNYELDLATGKVKWPHFYWVLLSGSGVLLGMRLVRTRRRSGATHPPDGSAAASRDDVDERGDE